VLLAAGRAPRQLRAEAGQRRIRVETGNLELDVAVELVEALVTADLGLGRESSDDRGTELHRRSSPRNRSSAEHGDDDRGEDEDERRQVEDLAHRVSGEDDDPVEVIRHVADLGRGEQRERPAEEL
jgi:hypothetical protein